jgi:hypothetical protein
MELQKCAETCRSKQTEQKSMQSRAGKTRNHHARATSGEKDIACRCFGIRSHATGCYLSIELLSLSRLVIETDVLATASVFLVVFSRKVTKLGQPFASKHNASSLSATCYGQPRRGDKTKTAMSMSANDISNAGAIAQQHPLPLDQSPTSTKRKRHASEQVQHSSQPSTQVFQDLLELLQKYVASQHAHL